MSLTLELSQPPTAAAPTRATYGLIRPVILAGIANALLFFAIDRTQVWSLVAAGLAMVLVGVVLVRQLNLILSLEHQVSSRMEQLSAVSEVVSALNSSPNVGSTLGLAIDRLTTALRAERGVVWLAAVDGTGYRAVEDLGEGVLPPTEELLELIVSRESPPEERLLRLAPRAGVHCLVAKMGRPDEALGFLALQRAEEPFSEMEAALLAAVASDIGAGLRSVRMLSEARRLADRDPVTGVLNHRSGYQRLYSEAEKARATSTSLAVLMMDLDNFKLFNDTYGHPAGDEVLKRVASVLQRTCRQTDVVVRYGGDEFMVILPETDVRQAVRCAERIQANLARERFRCQDSSSLPIGFSYGIGVYPTDATEVMELVSVADTNLYQSKSEGGNVITSRGNTRSDSSLIYVKGYDLFRAMVAAIDNKDGYTRKHSEEVTEYSLQIAKAAGMDEAMLQTIQLAGILHDVGKIGIPDAILRKPGNLTDDEYRIMQQHPEFGALIVGAMPGMEEVVLGVRYHHERFDGGGYPDGLRGDEIPQIGRIMAIADAFSAMTTTRPYRKGLTERQALAEIKRGLGTQFDPELGATFIRLREERLAQAAAARRPRKPRAKPAPAAELAPAES
ncbi:MAG: diguanylate cyclase [Armatimonadota bacterium]